MFRFQLSSTISNLLSLLATKPLVKVRFLSTLTFPCVELAADSLRGRVFEISLADLKEYINQKNLEKTWHQIEEVKKVIMKFENNTSKETPYTFQ